jgi:hypothetical protein
LLIAAAVFLLGAAAVAPALAQQAPRPPSRPQAQAQAGPSFTLRNEGSRSLREFYASPPSESGWGSDRLGTDMVAPGASFRIQLPRGSSCVQDLKAVFDDNTEVERRNTDICRERTQAFANPQADTEFVVLNRSPRTIFQLYARPEGSSDDWGPDRLGADTISPDDRETIAFSASGQCSFDLRVVFDNDSAEERRAVDICATPVVVIVPGWTTSETMPDETAQAPTPGQAVPTRPTPSRPAPDDAPGRPQAAAGATTFRNQGASPLVRLSIDPPGAAAPGPDRLGDGVIAPGDSLAVSPPEGVCSADITAVFRDGTRLRREAVPVCNGAEVTLP